MNWALKDGNKVEAEPNESAICPLCNGEVISKCGTIKVWHWAHRNIEECDIWAENESQWHLDWKNEFPKDNQEVIIKKCISEYCNNKKYHAPCNHIGCVDCDFVKHRADIKTNNGLVIELQNSSISPEEIKEREEFYENMIWVINGEAFAKNLILRKKDKIYTFRWKNPPKSWWYSNKPIYIDFNPLIKYKLKQLKSLYDSLYDDYSYGERKITYENEVKELEKLYGGLFIIKKVYPNIPCGGYGEIINKEDFLKKFV